MMTMTTRILSTCAESLGYGNNACDDDDYELWWLGHDLCTVPRMRWSPTHWPGITSVCAIANSTLLFVMVISVLRINNESFCLEMKKMPDMSKPVFACKNPLSHTGCWPFYNDPPVGKMNPKCKLWVLDGAPRSKLVSSPFISKKIVYVCRVSKNHEKGPRCQNWGYRG